MTHFLEKTLSAERLKTYQSLAEKCKSGRNFEQLYSLNILYSKELYIILGALEILVRNSFNSAIAEYAGKKDWFDLDLFQPLHKRQLNKAIEYLTDKKKGQYIFDDIVAHLNFGFWVHLCDRPYEKNLWNKSLYLCFPYLGQKPNRIDVQRRLNSALVLRNKIAHLEPIIKNEETLIQEYRNVIQLLYAICPQTQEWFEKICNFEKIWNSRFKEIKS